MHRDHQPLAFPVVRSGLVNWSNPYI